MPDELFEASQENAPEETDLLSKKIEELKTTKTVDDLAKSKAHADQFIEFLKEQNAALKEDLSKKVNAEKLLEELRASKTVAEEKEGTDVPGPTPEDINALIEKNINRLNEKKVFENNIREVEAKVKAVHGDRGKEFIAQKAQELGLGLSYLGDVAQRSPAAFYSLIGLDAKTTVPSTAPSGSTVNSEALSKSSTLAEGTNSYYQELRRKDPVRFYSPEVQQKMFKDRKAKGDQFYN